MSDGLLVVLGDCLLDVDVEGAVERLCPDAPALVLDERVQRLRPGGAGLAAVLAAAGGERPVVLVTALADDRGGAELRAAFARLDIEVVALALHGATPEKVRMRSDGRTIVRVDRGGGVPERPPALPAAARAAIGWAGAVLVADYGRGMTALPCVREALEQRPRAAPLVWDPHPSGASPLAGATLATPNAAEAATFAAQLGCEPPANADVDARLAAALVRAWGTQHVCITRGGRGAVLVDRDGGAHVVPARQRSGDPCGAGDCFAVAATSALADGAGCHEAVTAAVRAASAFVAGGGASAIGDVRAAPAPAAAPDALALARRVRGAGGTLVATGGCFDLLHAGHLALLEGARSLGDALVVCLNDDASVARLKGPTRPIVPASERARLLAALRCVDAVHVFGEDTPCAALEFLRPDVWAKGGDYRTADLPETDVLQRWGGEVVLLPFVDDRSTTRLIQEASRAIT